MNKNDTTRVDLIIANDQHLYLKATDYKDRQKWLVALASQKALSSTSNIMNNASNLTVPLVLSNLQNTDESNNNEAKQTKSNDVSAENQDLKSIQHLSNFFAVECFL